MPRMYHPDHGGIAEVPDDEGCIAVHADAGWLLVPEPEALPGHEPEPVTHVDVAAAAPKVKRGGKTEPVKGKDATPD